MADNVISAPKILSPSQTSPINDGTLPPMDESVVNELSQPNMPTFQEFHAKVLGENQNKRRLGKLFFSASSNVTVESPEDSVNLILGQSFKDNVGTAANSNLSKNPYRSDEGVPHTSSDPTTASSDAATPIPHSPGTDTFVATSDFIFPSNVMENGGNGGANGKRVHSTGQELRVMRNIAASECGAKLLEASPSAKHAPAILVDNNDEYMNQPCSSEKWFIIETCEPVQLGIIQIANYELFSSRCKTFRVFVSDRYPAKQWEQIGVFQGQDVKGLQTFHISGSTTGRLIKYVKFEMLDHYGNEHFCPITMVRLFGLSSDEMDEPGLPPPPLSRSSPPGDLDTTLKESDGELEGNTNTSLLNKTRVTTSIDVQPSTKATSPTASKKQSGQKKFKKKKKKSTNLLDPPVNGSSFAEEVEKGDCLKGQTNKVTTTTTTKTSSNNSIGLWQHATRFILGVLQSAIGSKSSLKLQQAPSTALTNRADPVTSIEPSSDDFYSVIYIFSAASSNAATPPSTDAKSRGLWHLARCLVALSSSPLPHSVVASHHAWADCIATEFLLNLTTTSSRSSMKSLLQFQRWAAAYRNLTSTFGRWPAFLMREQMGKNLPVPEFLKPRVKPNFVAPTSSIPAVIGAEALEQETVELSTTEKSPSPMESKSSSISSKSLPKSPMSSPKMNVDSHEDEEMLEDENFSPQPPSPSPLGQSASSKKKADEEVPVLETNKVVTEATVPADSLRKQDSEIELVMAEGMEGEREVVLPAAMGGSWKETMYMRLNNKVLQLQSDVSVSMRYLEELSQSYKRQTERLSASFNLTTAWLKATAKGAEERDLLQQERIDALEAQLNKLLHILAERGVDILAPVSSQDLISTTTSSAVPHFRKPHSHSSSSTPSVDLQSILWSAFFQSPATAGPSNSLSTPSKRVFGPSSTSIADLTNRGDNDTRGDSEPYNTTVLSMFGRTSTPPGSVRPGSSGAHLSPPASLFFRRRRLRGQEAITDVNGPVTHPPGLGSIWKFIFVVVSQHLRNFLFSESSIYLHILPSSVLITGGLSVSLLTNLPALPFAQTLRLWLLHLCLAVLTQTFVYAIFLRNVLRRCPPLSPLILSPSSCKICSSLPTIEVNLFCLIHSHCRRFVVDCPQYFNLPCLKRNLGLLIPCFFLLVSTFPSIRPLVN
ncbi:unnamed protein product [Hydatigera taeniaeformis]|uniref:SUN domain-containing protein n=1 Tax=Hydatigena taeniaeformis TaxID=6205 RepID=A0A3P7FTE6_HYDTA|nr:unnamed protein product [Hydatigera taeniaeformis]